MKLIYVTSTARQPLILSNDMQRFYAIITAVFNISFEYYSAIK